MQAAGLTDIEVKDFTPLVKAVWERRLGRQRRQRPRDQHASAVHRAGYSVLLENPSLKLGEGIFYIHVRGVKPAKAT